MTIKYEILSTGSKNGNCVLIDDCILIDMGMSLKRTKEYLDKVEYILITHRHGDHLKMPNVNYLFKNHPRKLYNKMLVNIDTQKFIYAKNLNLHSSINPNSIVKRGDTRILETKNDQYIVHFFHCEHDVEALGFSIVKLSTSESLIYATDTSNLDDAPDNIYDYILLEGNYDEEKLIEDLTSPDEKIAMRAVRNMRHLSMQSFTKFVTSHSHPNTVIVQLHESEEYGRKATLPTYNFDKLEDLT